MPMPRVLLALLLSVAAPLAVATPAVAGGPTSVLLTNPGAETAAGLYYSDPRYAELEGLLHGADAAVESSASGPGAAPALTLTWLIHDVTIWRVDRLALDGSGEAWVSTTSEWDGQGLEATSGAWHRLQDGDRIRQIVASIGLLGGDPDPQAAASSATAREAADDAGAAGAAPAPPVVREETRWFSLTGWRWAVPGLLLGLLVAGFARRRRPAGVPRQELVDRSPSTVPG